jgi:CDP-4-dehydro-6-deoxyglucose reductase
MCCNTAASSELTLELLEASGPQDIPEQQIVTQVRAITATGTRHPLCTCRPRAPTGCASGRAVGPTGPGPCRGKATCTPPTRWPVARVTTAICFFSCARDEADALARHLFARDVKPGEPITVLGPTGEFVLADGNRPLVFAACDGGFAPIKSLIEHALSLDAAPSLSLFWLATRSDGHFASNQCRAWSEALDQFEYELVTHADTWRGAQQIAQAMRADLFEH